MLPYVVKHAVEVGGGNHECLFTSIQPLQLEDVKKIACIESTMHAFPRTAEEATVMHRASLLLSDYSCLFVPFGSICGAQRPGCCLGAAWVLPAWVDTRWQHLTP